MKMKQDSRTFILLLHIFRRLLWWQLNSCYLRLYKPDVCFLYMALASVRFTTLSRLPCTDTNVWRKGNCCRCSGALKPLIALNTSAFLGMVETHRSAHFLKNCQANFCEHFTLNMNFTSFTLIWTQTTLSWLLQSPGKEQPSVITSSDTPPTWRSLIWSNSDVTAVIRKGRG